LRRRSDGLKKLVTYHSLICRALLDVAIGVQVLDQKLLTQKSAPQQTWLRTITSMSSKIWLLA